MSFGRTRSPTPPRSRLRAVDQARESWRQVTARPGRSALAALGAIAGVAAATATLTLVETAQAQVSSAFDARRATQLEIRVADHAVDAVITPDAEARVRVLSGVRAAGIVADSGRQHRVASNRVDDPGLRNTAQASLYGASVGALEAAETELEGPGWSGYHERSASKVVVLGATIAESLGIQGWEPDRAVLLEGVPFTVAGILRDSGRVPGLRSAVLLPLPVAEKLYGAESLQPRLLVVTAPGAASSVAEVAPLAVDPVSPDNFVALAPPDPEQLRNQVEGDLATFALGLSAAVLLLGMVSIGNVVTTTVVHRIPELGLRRALGARPVHIAAHVVADSAAIGTFGGLAGALVGCTATLGAAAAQGWMPVVDLRYLLLAPVAGLVCGGLAGLWPARLASRVEPTEALRRG